jgi:hypothetical protein
MGCPGHLCRSQNRARNAGGRGQHAAGAEGGRGQVPRELARRLERFHAEQPAPPDGALSLLPPAAVPPEPHVPPGDLIDAEGARLAAFVLGHVSRSAPAVACAHAALAPLLRRADLGTSPLEAELPPHARAPATPASGAHAPVLSEPTSTPHAAFQAPPPPRPLCARLDSIRGGPELPPLCASFLCGSRWSHWRSCRKWA